MDRKHADALAAKINESTEEFNIAADVNFDWGSHSFTVALFNAKTGHLDGIFHSETDFNEWCDQRARFAAQQFARYGF